MLSTPLMKTFGLRYPIIGAPMAGVAEAPLAAAITTAGGLGMIGVGSQASPDFIIEQANLVRDQGPFGIGLMVWALKSRPHLLEAALRAKPDLISLSFGDPTPYIEPCHRMNIQTAVQVHNRQEARQARESGADILVAQGTEAGGHTGHVATFPLLQIVLQESDGRPVVAAGGIATAEGIAGALAMGADAVWIGTAFLTCSEARQRALGRARLLEATEMDTVLTHVYDRIQQLEWPEPYPGRALTNDFTSAWHGREADMLTTPGVHTEFLARRGDYRIDYLYAGQAIGLVNREERAADLVARLGTGAETHFRQRMKNIMSD
ncbi:NAD(P)H-dependent flavin oxidoreductase [Sulfobacillus harzensis]|uniref:Probable nitronate monooxygenase n=1 Tax=Sulfobacillus harzensis TaxID=2729629 RepID=A0A7Y0Q375_9FIRM|nr:nitronate monooxygenase [Sulfobacillus harzensis]NMP23267.1 nitronate monooxygenase [Sulfobacillus harzensis]